MRLIRRVVAGTIGLTCVLALLASCRTDPIIAFNAAPPRTTFHVEPKPTTTAIFIGQPIATDDALRAAETALAATVAAIDETVAGVACGQRVKDVECVAGRITGTIIRNGPIATSVTNGRLTLEVPLSATLKLQGIGWAKTITDMKTQAFVVTADIEAILHTAYALDLAPGGTWTVRSEPLTFGAGQVDLAKPLQSKLKPVMATFAERFADGLTGQKILASVQRVWRRLQAPIQLASSPVVWLTADPTRVSGAGFHKDGDRLSYLIAVGVRATLHAHKPHGDRNQQAAVRKLPEPARSTQDMSSTQLRSSITIDFERIRSATARAFPLDEHLSSRGDRFAEPLEVATSGTRVYPSQRQLALALDMTVHAPKAWAGRKGRLHLLGRPQLGAQKDVITVDSVSVPSGSPQTSDGSAPPHGLLIGAEPFASRFAEGFKIDIAPDIRNAVAESNAGLKNSIDDNQTVTLKFQSGEASGVETSEAGLNVVVTMTGKLIIYDDGQVESSNKATSGSGLPLGAKPDKPAKHTRNR